MVATVDVWRDVVERLLQGQAKLGERVLVRGSFRNVDDVLFDMVHSDDPLPRDVAHRVLVAIGRPEEALATYGAASRALILRLVARRNELEAVAFGLSMRGAPRSKKPAPADADGTAKPRKRGRRLKFACFDGGAEPAEA